MCEAGPRSQSPTVMCLTCFNFNPHAQWLTWLVCTNQEEHKSDSRVTAVAKYSSKQLIKLRPLPAGITGLSDVALCENLRCYETCRQAHSKEERDYWLWEFMKRIYSKVVSEVQLW